MAQNFGGSIVKDSLQILLNAADPNSYPGTGTSWIDQASFINFNTTSYTYPSFSTDKSGCFTFVNNGSTVNNIYPSSISLVTNNQTEYTRIGAFNMSSLPGDWGPIIQNQIGNNSDMALTVLSNGKLHFRQYTNTGTGGTTSGDYGVTSTGATLSINTWYIAAIAVSRSAQTVNFYLNGALDSTVSITVIGNSSSNVIVIGGAESDSYGGNRMFKGKIANVAHYGRILTAAEILQNYNAQKSRFGLT
jgi:hypothetical protein